MNLEELTIKNFAYIDTCRVSFSEGFNVITGESGSGKSLVLKALLLVLGSKQSSLATLKADKEIDITATFSDVSKEARDVLHDSGFDIDKGEDIIVRRRISPNGKTSQTINAQKAPLQSLRVFGNIAIEISSQHAQLLLKDANAQLQLLDKDPTCDQLLKEYKKVHQEYRSLEITLSNLQTELLQSKQLSKENQDLLDRLNALDFKEDELESLEKESQVLANYEKISSELQSIIVLLEGDSGILPAVSELSKHLSRLSGFGNKFENLFELSEQGATPMRELCSELHGAISETEFNPQRQEEIESRLYEFKKYLRLYGPTYDELSQKIESLKKASISTLELEDTISEHKKNLAAIYNSLEGLSSKLSNARKAYAKNLEIKVNESLCTLMMSNANFSIDFTTTSFSENGIDSVCFSLANNHSSKKPLALIASGGELSRILFALKLSDNVTNRKIYIYDELDANIGGETATVYGSKLSELGKKHQIICITHFPQVAMQADSHQRIEKRETPTKSIFHIEELESTAKEKELMRMLGGNDLYLRDTSSK